jgi:type I restriction enzyme S subunit
MNTTNQTYNKLAWLGALPSHWKVVRIANEFKERTEIVSDKDFKPLSVTMQGIVPQLENIAKTDNGDNRKKVCIGDFVINSRSDRKGSGGISLYEGSVSVISNVLKANNNYDIRYTNYLFTNKLFQEEFYFHGKGIVADMWSTKYQDMRNICIPLPPKNEQEK